jgi:hypothetical protein
MTTVTTCPICGTSAPAGRASTEPWCCSLACYRAFHGLGQSASPSCHDAVTTICPACERLFVPLGRQTYCSGACRAAAYRRRRDTNHAPAVVVPNVQHRRTITVYECDGCGTRTLGEQYCAQCRTFMRRVGVGGYCPSCDEPVAVSDLLGQKP